MLGSSAQIASGEKEPIVATIVDSTGEPLPSLTDIKIQVRRNSDGYYLDWSDNLFKTSPTTMYQALTEISATNNKGQYKLNTATHVNGFDTATLTSPLPNEIYYFTLIQDGGITAANVPQMGELRVGGDLDIIINNLIQSQDPVTWG